MSNPPVVLMDVDCVLNADYPRGAGWTVTAKKRVWSDENRQDFQLVWAPAAITRLADLHVHQVIELVWCTTWCSEAHVLEELWDLPELRRAIPEHPTPNGVEGNRAKLAAVQREVATGRPFAWVDDSLNVIATRAERDALVSVCNALLVTPNPKSGISPADIDTIERFARSAAPDACS